MAKTRSQTGNITLKKEEEEDIKSTLLLNGVSNTRSNTRIAKRRPPITNNRRLPAQKIKVEEDTNTKVLLKSASKYSKRGPKQIITQEQINQLIHYIVNDNMSVAEASQKINMGHTTGLRYYNAYKNDPKKKIPVPRNQYLHPRINYTQEQIGNLIKYVDTDKMTVKEASGKANMTYRSGNYYYTKYLKDPNHNIPIARPYQNYTQTQDQKSEFIHCIINDKMTIKAASKKTRMNYFTAAKYYHNYFKVLNPDIARPSHIATRKCYTQEQIKEVIGYIVDDKMSIAAASRKANFCSMSAGRYYRQYLKDNDIKLPVARKTYTQDDISKLIGHVVNDKMTLTAASKKANMAYSSGYKYYRQYLKKN